MFISFPCRTYFLSWLPNGQSGQGSGHRVFTAEKTMLIPGVVKVGSDAMFVTSGLMRPVHFVKKGT